MQTRRISRGSPECLYVSVRNCGAATLYVGHHAIFAFHVETFADGVNVCTYGSGSPAVWQLAGIVSKYPIPPGAWGCVQIHGYHGGISCLTPPAGLTNWASVATMVISPVTTATTPGWNTITTQSGWVAVAGGVIRLVGRRNTAGSTDSAGFWPGFIRLG